MSFKLTPLNFKIGFWIILLVGIGLRLYYMMAPETRLSADEAVYGVQALNILQGERSVFYYNQNYTGTLSAFVTAAFFGLFGIHDYLVKLPIFLFSIGFLFSSYFLAKLVFNSRNYALLSLLLTAITSPFWMNWTTRAGTGYPETMVFGNLIFILIIKNVYDKLNSRAQTVSFFLMGIFAGLGYWVQPTIIYYLLPSAAFVFFWKPKIFLTRLFLAGILGFVLGSLTVIVFNINHSNLNTQSLFHKPFGVKKAMVEFFTVGLPIMFGLRKPFSRVDFSTLLTYLVSGIYLLAFGWLLVKRLLDVLKTLSFGLITLTPRLKIAFSLQPVDLILLFSLSVFIIFSFSSPFNQFIEEPRYIGPLYTALPILIVFLVKEIKERFNKGLAMGLYLIVLGTQIFGLTQVPVGSFVSQVDLKETIQTLREKNIKYVDTHALVSYHLVLESGEEIIAATRDNPPIEARYPEYRRLVNTAPLEEKGLLLDHQQQLVPCQKDLLKQHGPCQETKLKNGFYLYTWR